MRHRPVDRVDLPFRRFHPDGNDADGVATGTNIESFDHLAIHLHLSYDSKNSDNFVSDEPPEKIGVCPSGISLTNCEKGAGSTFPFMAESPPTSQGTPSEDSKVARTYSIAELLSMRNELPFVICNIDRLNPKITSDIIKVPENVRANLKQNARSSRNLSSTARRTSSRSSHAMTRSGESDRSHIEGKNGHWSQEDQEEVIVFRGNLALQSMNQKQMWMLRKRSNSDRLSQPFAAPTGYEAQKADNFKKFYAAVISPTHLRVTAGGRIVPNTRALPHPTFMWNAENQVFESTERSIGTQPESQGPFTHGSNINAADPHSSMAIVKPATENFFGPPLQLRSSIQSNALPDKDTVYCVGSAPPDVAGERSTEAVICSTNGDTTALQSQIKISPPSQFDVFRPFFINGQPFYPAPSGNHVQSNVSLVPLNLLGSLNAPYQPLLSTYGMVQQSPLQFQAGNFGYSHQLPPDTQQITHQLPSMQNMGFAPPMMGSQSQVQAGQPFNAAPLMPLSSLPSEQITMHPQAAMMVNQIQTLQQQLKHFDNQLQNNRHQIDEQHVINQQYHVQNQIRVLQSGLNAKVMQPTIVQPDQHGSPGWNIGMGMPLPGTMQTGLVTDRSGPLETNRASTSDYQIIGHGVTVLKNEETTIGVQAPLAVDSYSCQPSARPTQTSRKRLSAAAAMAPEFQPRSHLTVGNQPGSKKAELLVNTMSDCAMTEDNAPQQVAEIHKLSNVTNWSTPGQWKSSTVKCGLKVIPTQQIIHQLTDGTPLIQSTPQLQMATGLNIPGPPNQVILPATGGSNPYLTGYPPPGIPAHSVRSADMVYSRELTNEELQARQIYWGKASRTLSIGLPKFDGKDFYAPSPEKNSENTEESLSNLQNQSTRGASTSSTTAEKRASELKSKKVTVLLYHDPIGSKDALQVTQSSENPINDKTIDAGKPSPDFDTASLDAWGMVKADEDEIFDQRGPQATSFNKRVSHIDTANSADAEVSVDRREAGRYPQPTFLQDMLKNSSHTSMATKTGALLSTTVKGYLPQYGGLAAASLAPSINNVSASGLSHNNQSHSRIENQPLPRNLHRPDGASATERLKKLKGKGKETVDHDFNSKVERFGPVYGDSAW